MLEPILRAISQLNDPVFQGVVWRSLVLSLLAFAGLLAGSVWGLQQVVAQPGWWGWLAGLAGGIAGGLGAAVLALYLFVPAALLIATLYIDRVAAAVDRRFYPTLPVPAGAPLAVQAWDGVALGAQVLGLQAVALLLALLLPGFGLVLGWLITGWGIGRGLFVAVAMRRMSRPDALVLYARRRLTVVLQGCVLAAAASVPLLNLLVPVLGTAAMVHVLHRR